MHTRWARTFAIAALLALFGLLCVGARETSLTADEPTYIGLGYALWAAGQEAFPLLVQRGYPPLLPLLESALLYWPAPRISVQALDGWPDDYAAYLEALEPHLQPLDRTKILARMPIVYLTVLLAALVHRWARELWGLRAASMALGALLFDPLLLAHGTLAHSDAGVVVLGSAALYVTWRWTLRPSWGRALGVGVLLGLTMLAKISGLLWFAAAAMMVLATAWLRRSQRTPGTYVTGAVLALGTGLVLLWAGYGFEVGVVEPLAIPAPAPTHWANLRYLDGYRDVYFALGLWSERGWWWYFPLAFLIKNPLPLLIGLAIGLAVLLRRRATALPLVPVALFPLLYTGVAIWERLNLGYRHMLPVHPYLYLIVGGGLGQFGGGKGRTGVRALAFAALSLWYGVGTLRVFPYELSFFNELVGGAEGGYRYLSDSNVGWGQTTDLARAYLDAHPDVQGEPPQSAFRPAAGRYLVSATYLQGIGLADRDAYAWFRHWSPAEDLAYSMLLYDVPAFETAWFARCDPMPWQAGEAAILDSLGEGELRAVTFDCSRAWIYPDGGASSGMYALSGNAAAPRKLCLPSLLFCLGDPADPFLARHLAGARLSFASTPVDATSSLVLYERSATASLSHAIPSRALAYAADAPVQADARNAASLPIQLDGPLAFLGTHALAGDQLDVETWWQVTGDPVARSYSIAAHLLSTDGQVLALDDGLGISPLGLWPGDVLVQRHRFAVPVPPGEVWLATGVYWQDTAERWAIQGLDRTVVLVRLTVDHASSGG